MSDYQPKFQHGSRPVYDGTDPEDRPESRRSPGSRFLMWLGRTVGKAIVIVLVIVLLPHASKWLNALLPDAARNAVTVSTILSHELRQSARLETATVDEDGVLVSSVDALWLGTVQSVTIQYTYHASVGIDLSQVQVRLQGSHITLVLPPAEVISDSLIPVSVDRQDFWYPLTDARRQQLLSDELEARRAAALAEAQTDQVWQRTVSALESTVSTWISAANQGVTISYDQREAEAP